MTLALTVFQCIICLLLVGIILLQRSSTDGLAGLGSGGAMGIVSRKASSNFLSKTTMLLSALFMINSLLLANIAYRKHHPTVSAFQSLPAEAQSAILLDQITPSLEGQTNDQ